MEYRKQKRSRGYRAVTSWSPAGNVAIGRVGGIQELPREGPESEQSYHRRGLAAEATAIVGRGAEATG
jgi:hypothetical protein